MRRLLFGLRARVAWRHRRVRPDRRRGNESVLPSEAAIDPDLLRVPIGPGSIHVERYGRGGTSILLIHGFGTSGFLWRNVGPSLAHARHTAIAVDMLGYGESDRPPDAEFGIAAQAHYVTEAMSSLGISRAAIVGVDLGGAVALRLAVTSPAHVSHLVLVNSLTHSSTPAGDVRGLRRSIARFTLQIANGLMGAAPLLTPLLEGSVADREYMPWRLVARYLAPYVGQDGARHFLALASSVTAQDMADVEPDDVRAPTLIVRGDADQWVEDEVAVRLAGAIPSSRLVRLPGVGRLVPEEAPDQLVGLILDFIEGRGAPITGADESPASASD